MNIVKRHPVEFGIAALALVVIISLLSFGLTTHANPGGFPPGARTSVATSTPALMTPNTGTSTVVYDSYNINGTNQGTTGVTSDTDSASLLVQFQASSSVSKIKIAYEFSQDGVDWYQDGTSIVFASTTTGVITPNIPNSFIWTFASTSLGGGPITGNNLATEAFPVPTPTRYVRAVISDIAGTVEVWAQFVPKKQQP